MTLTPTLAARLRDYAEFYAETYGTGEEMADLVPFMLEAVLMRCGFQGRQPGAGGAKDPLIGAPQRLNSGFYR
jgi:hypothetical protein